MSLIKANDADFKDHVGNNETVVVKYFANWCGSCKLIAPKFRKLAEREAYQGLTFLDVNAEENPEARKAAGVTNLPFFALFRNGKLVEGDTTAKIETVEEMINRHAKTEAS